MGMCKTTATASNDTDIIATAPFKVRLL